MALGKQLSILVSVLAALLAASVSAADTDAHKSFTNFVFVGCMPSVVTKSSLDTFVTSAHLSPAKPQLAEALLRGRPGKAYVPSEGQMPIAILERADGSCTVAARTMPDLEGLVAAVEKMLVGPGAPFQREEPKESKAGNGSVVTNRAYKGQMGGQNFYVLFSTTPAEGTIAQAMITVARVKN